MIIVLNKMKLKIICLVFAIVIISSMSAGIIINKNILKETSSENKTPVTIVMYHCLLKDDKMKGKFVISPEQFESDIKYLKDNGYNFINMQDLINFVTDESSTLPDNPVMITFDDGYYNNYLYAYPIMKQYEGKFILSIIGKCTDINKEDEKMSPYYSNVTWEQIKEMHDSGIVEIQNHSYDLHNNSGKRAGALKKRGESIEEYTEFLAGDVMKLQDLLKEKTGITPTTFTYPFGRVSTASVDILKNLGFKASLSCYEGINYIEKGDLDSLYRLKRYNRPNGKTSENFFKNKLANTK